MLIRDATDIGLVIRDRRQKLGLDQQELAKRVKVSRQWIVEVEKGRPRAELGLVLRAIGTLGLTVSVGTPDDAETGYDAETGASVAAPSVDIDHIIDDLASDDLASGRS